MKNKNQEKLFQIRIRRDLAKRVKLFSVKNGWRMSDAINDVIEAGLKAIS